MNLHELNLLNDLNWSSEFQLAEQKNKWMLVAHKIRRSAQSLRDEPELDRIAPSSNLVAFVLTYISLTTSETRCAPTGFFFGDDGTINLEWVQENGVRLTIEFERIEAGYAYGETMLSYTKDSERKHEFKSWKTNTQKAITVSNYRWGQSSVGGSFFLDDFALAA